MPTLQWLTRDIPVEVVSFYLLKNVLRPTYVTNVVAYPIGAVASPPAYNQSKSISNLPLVTYEKKPGFLEKPGFWVSFRFIQQSLVLARLVTFVVGSQFTLGGTIHVFAKELNASISKYELSTTRMRTTEGVVVWS